MIEITSGNLITTDTEALVNTVNCVGVMGKGIALQFKKAFPLNYESYRDACEAGEVEPGRVLVTETGSMVNPKYIINFPTKRHWKGKSRIEDIDSGLIALKETIKAKGIKSIAVPPLGCGNGGLNWDDVRPLIISHLEELEGVQVLLFEPGGVPVAYEMPVRTRKPKLTRFKALVVMLLDKYAAPGYRVSMLEVQKLAWFLDRAGEPTKLKFVRGKYGPYSEQLNYPIHDMDGHYLNGSGDRAKVKTQLMVIPNAISEAKGVIGSESIAEERLTRVFKLIDGFETPYGLELLATVDWLANSEYPAVKSADEVIEGVANWSVRKKQMFKPAHIRAAFNRLVEEDWIKA